MKFKGGNTNTTITISLDWRENMIFISKIMGSIIAFLLSLMIILGLSILIIMFFKFFKQILKEK